MTKLDCTAQNIIAYALDTNEFFRISKCKTPKEMWYTLKAAHGNNELMEARSKGQARRKRRQNKKSLNLCFMTRKEDDSSSVSSSNSSNCKNYSCTALVVGSDDVASSYSLGVLTRRQVGRREGSRGTRVVASY